MGHELELALGLSNVSQSEGDALFGLTLVISLLVMWWTTRVGRPFFALYPRLVRILLWASVAIIADSLLTLLMLWIPVSTILSLGATGLILLAAEDQAIHLYLIVVLPCIVGLLLTGSVLIMRQLLRERKARRQREMQ